MARGGAKYLSSNSNTTLVKVKFTMMKLMVQIYLNSNTTLVKVK